MSPCKSVVGTLEITIYGSLQDKRSTKRHSHNANLENRQSLPLLLHRQRKVGVVNNRMA